MCKVNTGAIFACCLAIVPRSAEAGTDVRSQAGQRLEGCNMLTLTLTSFLSALYNAIYEKLGPEEDPHS